ncbi:MAG: PEGA domain-containing protein [Sideroxydans sp.]
MRLFRFVFAPLALVFVFTGCASTTFEPGNELHVRLPDKPSPGAREQKYPVTVRVAPYTDGRSGVDPRQIGISTTRILGLFGKQIMLDREVANLVGEVMQKQLGDTGFQVLAPDTKNAQFQLNGSIKTLSIDIKERDYMNIVIESTLTEVASGKVIWSGMVAEKKDRFAGTSGNSKQDVADFLRHGLQVVSAKTSESLLSVLMATRPDLFGLNAAVKLVPGVTVHSTAMPTAPVPLAAASAAAKGVLLLKSIPPRAKIYVDDVYYGLTPLRIDLVPGIYPVRVELDGYQPVAEKVSVRSKDDTELEMKLRK